jgi:hypothetical protein
MKTLVKVCALGAVILAAPISSLTLSAHCDAWDGPVIIEAREAFRAGDVTPVLKWVSAENESTIAATFEKATSVAAEGDAARELAELWFLETLVRIHREGEGAPYTGLKPAGEIDQAVQLADEALETGSVEILANRISLAVARQIADRFNEAASLRGPASDSPAAGREYVAAYVDYIHFVEAVHNLISHGEHGH